MNPLTNVRNITKLNEREISLGISDAASWHAEYKHSAWIFIGGLDFMMTEGDVLAVLSQYGEIVNINLIRDKKTGKSKGYCFLCYEDQRSTNLAVDNFNGIKLCHRTIRVDHVANYKMPKDDPNAEPETNLLRDEGCAPKVQQTTLEIEAKGNPIDTKKATLPKVKRERNDLGYDKYDIRRSGNQRKEEIEESRVEHSQRTRDDRRDRNGDDHGRRSDRDTRREQSSSFKSKRNRSEHVERKSRSGHLDSDEERRRRRCRRRSTSSDSDRSSNHSPNSKRGR